MEYIKKFGEFIDEGIDFDLNTKTVSYNPSHEDNVDTSIENNPTSDENLVPNMIWRGTANLLMNNWLNYFVYQKTPYDLSTL